MAFNILVFARTQIKKYLYCAKMSLQYLAAYPNKFYVLSVSEVFTLTIFYFLWKGLYGENNLVMGFTFTALITYYSISLATKELTKSSIMSAITARSVQQGTLSGYLLQPISFGIKQFFEIYTARVVAVVIPITVIILLPYFVEGILEKPVNLAYFTLSLGFATVLTFLIYSLIGCAAFWTTTIWGINSIVARMIRILSGGLIPLTFFPLWFQEISKFLPFQYTVYVPTSIYVGTVSGTEMVRLIVIQFVWILFLILIRQLVWRKALIKYDAVGN